MKKIPLGAEIRIYKNPYGTEYDRISIRVKNERDPDYDKVLNFDAYGFDTTEKAIAVALKNFGQAALESEKGNGEIREVKPLTNADRIRSMSDQEIAGFLDRLSSLCVDCSDYAEIRNCPLRNGAEFCGPENILAWLQAPAEEDTYHA